MARIAISILLLAAGAGTASAALPVTFEENQPKIGGNSDTFVTVLDPSGSRLAWSTFVGGSGAEGASSIALDSSGDVHVGGVFSPGDAFVASNPSPPNLVWDPTSDAFAAKIKGDGSALVYLTHLGGSNQDSAKSVAADAAGNTYIAGATNSKDLPFVDAVEPSLAGTLNALVAKFDGQTGAVQYATYLGGTTYDYAVGIAADASGNALSPGMRPLPTFP